MCGSCRQLKAGGRTKTGVLRRRDCRADDRPRAKREREVTKHDARLYARLQTHVCVVSDYHPSRRTRVLLGCELCMSVDATGCALGDSERTKFESP